MSLVSILLSVTAVGLAWFTVGPGWLPLATVTAAALLAFSETVTALRAKNWGHWSLRALVLALVVLLALPTIGQLRPQESSSPAVADAGPLSLPPAASTTDAAAPAVMISNDPPLPSNLDVTAVHARTTSLDQRVSKTRFNLDARMAALGEGVDPAFAFMRDFIGFDSYPGVLRGDRGTFLARAGNSWDRALLLTAILKAKGVRTRFATARLDDRSAAQLFERLFVEPTPAAGDPPATASPSATRDTAFSDRIKARATRDLGLVRAALAAAWPSDAGISRDAVIAELREHAWVQADVGAGWQDLDPSLPGSRPGQPLVPAESTFDEVPEDRYQHVTIRLLAETLSDGDLATTPRLEWSARAPEVLGRTMFLTHVPSGTGATGKLARMAGEQWRPALWLGETIHTGDPVAFGSSGSNSAGSFFFGESSSTLVAEWLELEFDQTGGRTDTTRRALFDRATPAARAGTMTPEGLLPVPMVDNGPVPALALHNLWFTAGGHDLAAYANTIATLSAEIPDLGKSELEPGAQLSAMAMANFAFLVYSDHIILPSVNDAPGVRLYADSPRALIFSLSPDARGPGAATSVYDLHRDRVRAVARDASLGQAAIDRKIWFGLLEGALEHEMTAADVADAGGTAEHYLTTSALVTGAGVATMREGTTDQALALAGDQPRADRMLAAVARGSSLVVPRPQPGQPARGWWEIAANGDTKAVTDGDLGGSVAWGKGLGGGRIGSGYGTPDGRMPRLIRPRPTPGGSGSQEYLTLLTTIALAVIIAFEIIGFTIHLRAVMRGMTVLESMDRDFGGE